MERVRRSGEMVVRRSTASGARVSSCHTSRALTTGRPASVTVSVNVER
jgi:hypothetical protein